MILLATNHEDITTDFIVLELNRRGLPYFRLNTEWVGSADLELDPARVQTEFSFRFADEVLELGRIRAAYYRRPMPAQVDSDDVAAIDYCRAEWMAVLKSMYWYLSGKWLNCPFSIDVAENKPMQLSLAHKLGFRVPETRITNSPQAIADLMSRYGLVAKPLRQSYWVDGGDEKVVFTTRLDSADLAASDQISFSMAPAIYQQEIKKRVDVRATVVGNKVFSAAIHSQKFAETQVDWRLGGNINLAHEAHELPLDVQEKCIELTKHMSLKYAAIDLVEDRHGRYWFLEANPNGQWAWIENRTGLPIAAAIVDQLEMIGEVGR
jgi:hypothetical protein